MQRWLVQVFWSEMDSMQAVCTTGIHTRPEHDEIHLEIWHYLLNTSCARDWRAWATLLESPSLYSPPQSRAYRTILTHFSTRYPKLPEMDIVSNGSIAVAMDLMSVNLADLAWLPRIVEPLGLLLKAEKEGFEAEDEEGA